MGGNWRPRQPCSLQSFCRYLCSAQVCTAAAISLCWHAVRRNLTRGWGVQVCALPYVVAARRLPSHQAHCLAHVLAAVGPWTGPLVYGVDAPAGTLRQASLPPRTRCRLHRAFLMVGEGYLACYVCCPSYLPSHLPLASLFGLPSGCGDVRTP